MFFKNILIISLLCTTICLPVAVHDTILEWERYVHNPPHEIVQGFVNGDARIISKHFNASVELIISETSGVYGKAQAEQILRTFFNNNSATSGKFNYKPLHGSDRENVQYFIGELQTGKGLFRVTIYLKDKLIHRMTIESND